MFTKAELQLLNDSYFTPLRNDENFYEIVSKNTEHCWIIQKHQSSTLKPIFIHHKHSIKDPYYHKHGQSKNIDIAIKIIQKHDNYVINTLICTNNC